MKTTTDDLTPWVCIARTGAFDDANGNPHTFAESDLEAISKGYDPATSEAPLVFGHPKDSDPAYGWVKSLKREGAKLYAQFAHVPAQVKELVQNGSYRYVSMSLSPDKKRLLHVGLLGAAAPAIDGLGPVSLSAEGVTINFSAENGGGNMTEELQRQIGALNEQIKALQKENGELKSKLGESSKGKEEAEKAKGEAAKKAADSAAEFAAYKGQIAAAARAARVRALVDGGKLEPAKEAEALSFAAALADVQKPVNFAAADGKVEEISAEERYFRDLESRAPDARFTMNFAAPAPAPAHAANKDANISLSDITVKL